MKARDAAAAPRALVLAMVASACAAMAAAAHGEAATAGRRTLNHLAAVQSWRRAVRSGRQCPPPVPCECHCDCPTTVVERTLPAPAAPPPPCPPPPPAPAKGEKVEVKEDKNTEDTQWSQSHPDCPMGPPCFCACNCRNAPPQNFVAATPPPCVPP
mmetsp:Transcript_29481/g.84759  ORF Transcript_29481/g.84759 Transcript_29481/m.84759 type:complete len:156 (+) Transcript_29481:73-540(+)